MSHSIGLIVNGTMEIHPDDREKFVALVSQNVADSQGVEGCIHYAFAADVRNPNLFHNIEAWTDRAALENHLSGPLMQAAFAAVKRLRVISRDVTAYSVSGSSAI